jgi:hypothetical protein
MSNANEPAFPSQTHEYDGQGKVLQYDIGGLTKREHIAAMALQGWLATFTDPDCRALPDKCAKFAVECADALLAELERAHD